MTPTVDGAAYQGEIIWTLLLVALAAYYLVIVSRSRDREGRS
jgi:hypothetical protein